MVERKEMDELIWNLLRGFPEGFEICELVQEAVSYKRSIPKLFWLDEDKAGYGILGLNNLNKAEMKSLREEVIERIINEISKPNGEKCMYADNYSRLFHALTILKVAKCNQRVPAISKNCMYNIAYDLWALDDGKENNWETISNVAWYAAEAVKKDEFILDSLITGRRHNFS